MIKLQNRITLRNEIFDLLNSYYLKNEVNLSKNMSKSGALLFESSSDLTCKILSSAIEKKKNNYSG